MAVAKASQMSLILEEDSGFDYSAAGFSADVVARARNVAMGIRRKGSDIHRMILEIGQGLLWAKDTLGHGHFLAWLGAETGMSAKTAQRYMQVAENLDPRFVAATTLPSNVLYSLAAPSTPAPVRELIAQRTLAGERPEPRTVLEQIAASKVRSAAPRVASNIVALEKRAAGAADALLDDLASDLGPRFSAYVQRMKAIGASDLFQALARR